jgi:transposase InsO family protein
LALVELSVVEQRYRAVLAVRAGESAGEVAAHFGVSRQTVQNWLRRYREHGLAGLVDQSRRPKTSPGQTAAEVEAVICELRRKRPRWGARRIAHELGRAGVVPAPSQITVHRVLVRHGLVVPRSRKRRREDYRRWQREAPMALWQLDIVGGLMLADGTEAKVVTGVDDHSRFCVLAAVVARATGRAVCLAFAEALRRYGIPDEVLTDNGKQFTDRFGKGGEVLFDRICRDNGIAHRLTQPASPTTTGKVERFHQTLRRELLDDHEPFPTLLAAQAAIDTWVAEYNCDRPHQGIDMAFPADRFGPGQARRAAAEGLLPLRLPAVMTGVASSASPTAAGTDDDRPATATATGTGTATATATATAVDSDPQVATTASAQAVYRGGPVEFDRVVPPSGNLAVRGKQFWLGPHRAGLTVRFWADEDVIHLSIAGARVKSVRSHLTTADLVALAAAGASPAGPPPLPPAQPGAALEVDRVVSRAGTISLGNRVVLAAEILAGRRVAIRIGQATLAFFDPDTRELLRTRPNPLTFEQARRLRGARPAGPPPRPSIEPITVTRRASNSGGIMVAGQKIALGRHHARQVLTVHVAATTLTVELDGATTRTFPRTTTDPIRAIKAQRPTCKDPYVS